jgi:hypothetical protein
MRKTEMPVYTFRNAAGERIEKFMSVGEYGRRVKNDVMIEDGQRFTRDLAADLATTGGPPTGGYYIRSSGAGVHPSQIPEAKALAAKEGIKIDFAPDGDAIFTSRSQRKRYLKSRGLVDRSGGYGD